MGKIDFQERRILMINKIGFFSFYAIMCLLVFTGNSFAAEKPASQGGFLNNNSSPTILSRSTIFTDPGLNLTRSNGGATETALGQADFSLPTTVLERFRNGNPGSMMQSINAPGPTPSGIKRKTGKIMTIVGLGLIGGGTIMAVVSGDPKELGNSGVGFNWRATGYLWIGVGCIVTIVGLILNSK
jgi:hypothetical protein